MAPNMTNLPLIDMTPGQFRDWIRRIAEHSLFVDRERLLALLTIEADRETLTEAFRGFFEDYYYDMAFELDRQEACLLSIFNSCDTYASLRYRVTIVEGERKASPLGREVRRTGSFLPSDPVPQIKVSALSNRDFRSFLNTLVNYEFFAARDSMVKLLSTVSTAASKLSAHEAADAEDMRLWETVYEFFVCHLELEQFLEDYEYDPDEGLDIHPEVAEELEQSIADHKSGEVKGKPLQEVAKEFGVTLKCTH